MTTKTIRIKKPADPFAAQINAKLAERKHPVSAHQLNKREPWWKHLTRALGGQR